MTKHYNKNMKLKELLENVTTIYYADYPKSMYANINHTSEYPIDSNDAGVKRYWSMVQAIEKELT